MDSTEQMEVEPSCTEPSAVATTPPSSHTAAPLPVPSSQEPKSPTSLGEAENVQMNVAEDPLTETTASTENVTHPRPVDDNPYRLKRRKIKADGAPKMPLTGYVRYMAARREQLRLECPDKSSVEYTKIIGEEWSALSNEKKKPYLKEAEEDRKRYLKELNEFFKDRPDILASELAKNKMRKRKENLAAKTVLNEKSQINGGSVNGKTSPQSNSNENIPLASIKNAKNLQNSQTTQTSTTNGNRRYGHSGTGLYENGGIPIFTEEFLEHNKCVDMELRTLRKSNVDFEQQNAVLEKHVENMKFGVEKLVTENDELQEKNRLLEIYLEKLKLKLAQAFAGLAIPSEPNGATLENIDKYMSDLHKMATSNTHGPASLNKARDIIRKLDLAIQL